MGVGGLIYILTAPEVTEEAFSFDLQRFTSVVVSVIAKLWSKFETAQQILVTVEATREQLKEQQSCL